MSSGYLAAASFAQRQLRTLDLLQPGRAGYAVPLLVEITGPVDEAALRRAFAAVVDRHDVLRASFPVIDGVPALAVRDEVAIDLPAVTVAVPDRAGWRAGLAGVMATVAARPFDLEHGPVLAAALARPDDAAAAGAALGLAVVFHHAVADGGSLPVFLDDLIAAYDAERAGTAPRWAELALQYPDYADWEQEQFGDPDSPALAEATRHWRDALRDVPAVMDLPLDRRRGAAPSAGAGATARLTLPGAVGDALVVAARRRGATPFLAFLAVFFAVLHRWSRLDDLVVTVPVSKRTRPELAPLIGLLVDTLPLRLSCGPDIGFETLLDGVQRTFLEGVRHRDVPFQRIVQAIGIERRADVVPLMQVLFGALEEGGPPPAAADGCRFAVLDDGVEQTAKADLSVVYRQTGAGVELWCRYDPALFDAASVDGLLACFGALAAAVARDPVLPIGDLPLIDEDAGRALIARFNATRRPYPADRTVPALFAEVAERFPDAPAIDEDGRTTRYADLAARSGRLAAALAAAGVGRGDAVVLVLPLSGRFIALVLAILRLGAVYVPLDPTHPQAHRARLAAAVGARAIVLDGADADEQNRDHGGIATLNADALDAAAAGLGVPPESLAVPSESLGAEDPAATAYVMFTSGSTGEPKGVAVPHRAIVRLVRDTDFAAFGPQTRAAVHSNPSFDASTLEIWAPLLNGGTAVVVGDRRALLDIAALRRILNERRVTMLWITAGLFHEVAGLDAGVFAGDRLVMTGGDVVNPQAARAVLAACAGSGLRLLNCYGPTENTTFSTTFDIAALAADAQSLPIGRPIANSTLYILDRGGRPLPAGVIGEIHVGGDGVAAGYVGDPERTAAAFLPDPFAGRPDVRMYRTGDHGRWRADGAVLFAGRADDQVKVRGFRIELDEIAAALGRHPGVRAVHVAAPRQTGGERQIVAYVVAQAPPAREAASTPADLRAFLEPLLPPHMLPHAYVAVEQLPLTLNGKVDRRALPAVEDRHYDRAGHAVAPRTDDERTLAGLWRDLLGLDQVGVTDSFFHVGGDSILAIRMAARAADAGLPLSPNDIFQLQTIERLAEAARAARPRPNRSPGRSPAAHGASDRVFPAELLPLAATGGERPFRLASVVFDRPVDVVELAIVVQRLAERHEALRLRRVRDGEASRVEIMAYVARLPIRTAAVPGLTDAGIDAWVAEHAARLGRGLDLGVGVTMAATLVERGPAIGPMVVLALHRAVADERTLALIAAELETAIRSGHAALPPLDGATACGDWLDWLAGYADEQAAGGALTALEAAAPRADSGIADAPSPAEGAAERETIAAERWLDPALSAALTESVPPRLGVAPLDLLATALATALAAALEVALEVAPPVESGRSVLIEAVDGSRCLPAGAPDAERLYGNLDGVLPILAPLGALAVEERLRAVKAARQAVAAAAPVYRVLGETFDLPSAALGVAWSMAPGAQGTLRLHSPPGFGPAVRAALLAATVGGRLRLSWMGAEPAGGAVAALDRAAGALAAVAALAESRGRPLYTPDDFPLAGLSVAELAGFTATADVEDIYPLSPMQEAMLVHSLAAVGSEVNFEQSCVRLRGRLDIAAFRHAWKTVFARHAVLRTAFHWRGLARPLQIVHRAVELPLAVERWPAFDAARLDALLAADRARGFALEQAPLVRLRLIQVAEDELYLVSSFHHLLVDGWCLSRLEREVRAAYETHRSGRAPLFDAPVPYRAYIAWLARADVDGSRRFFAELLAGPPERRRLFPPPAGPARGFVTARHTLDRAASRALSAFARRRGLTLAAVLHLAWAVWLAARLGSDDVVFGTTVSGRPAGVPGVEGIVGLFINNLPVRLRLAPGDRPAERLAAAQALLGRLQEHAHLSPTAVAEAAGAGGRSGALFDTLVVVENLASGTSAWSGAEGLSVETVHARLKTAYDLTFVAVPGEAVALSLVQPVDGRDLEDGGAVLAAVAAILTALPEAADGTLADLPRPDARPAPAISDSGAAPLRFATRPRSTLEARIADVVVDLSIGVGGGPGGGAVEAADLDTDFWRLGVTSLELVQLSLRLEQRLGRPVPISLLLEHRSVAALARAIEAGQSWSPVVPMNAAGASATRAEEPFVCVHPVAGDVSVFLDLSRALPAALPFWAMQAAGLEEGQEPLDSVEALAAANLEALAARGLPCPRRLGGYSFGGIVAFEMARQLARRGTPPERVIILDTPAPLERTCILPADPDRAHAEWLVRMAEVRARFQGVEPVLRLDDLLPLPAAERFAVAVERMHVARLVPPAATPAWLERAHRTSLVQYAAYLAYTPDPAQGRCLPLALVRAETPRRADLGEAENRQLALADLGWGSFSDTPVAVRRVAGDHVTMLGGESAVAVAALVAALLGVDRNG